MGSCRIHDDVETAGGGRIVLVADSVIFRGQGKKLDADARPYEGFTAASYSLEGGSGVYIYVATFNRVNENELGRNRDTITARGGLGIGKYGGGSGGVVVFDDNFYISAYQVQVNGGKAEADPYLDGCMNGGSGTLYYRKNNTLALNNHEMPSTAFTIVKVPEDE